MKNVNIVILSVIFFVVSSNIYSQNRSILDDILNKVKNKEFADFLKRFYPTKLPFSFNYGDMNLLWDQHYFESMKEKDVLSFVLSNTNEKYNSEKLEYLYGEIIAYNNNYILLTFRRNNWDPPRSESSNELLETILSTYDFEGKMISTTVIKQGSNRHFKKCQIDQNLIIDCESFYITNKEKKWPSVLTANHIVEKMKIDQKGNIYLDSKKEDKNVKVVFDNENGGYKLKDSD